MAAARNSPRPIPTIISYHVIIITTISISIIISITKYQYVHYVYYHYRQQYGALPSVMK